MWCQRSYQTWLFSTLSPAVDWFWKWFLSICAFRVHCFSCLPACLPACKTNLIRILCKGKGLNTLLWSILVKDINRPDMKNSIKKSDVCCWHCGERNCSCSSVVVSFPCETISWVWCCNFSLLVRADKQREKELNELILIGTGILIYLLTSQKYRLINNWKKA